MDIDLNTIEFIVNRTIVEGVGGFVLGTLVGFLARVGKRSNNYQAVASGIISVGGDFFGYLLYKESLKESSAGDVGSFLGLYLGFKVAGYLRGDKYSEEEDKEN